LWQRQSGDGRARLLEITRRLSVRRIPDKHHGQEREGHELSFY
jgi:hypothetical protein